MNVWVIIPTYNERGSLEALVHALNAQHIPNLSVLVVDDASPDGTGALADRLAQTTPQLSVLHRSGKGGLASAYVDGFRYALARGADLLVEMDADFSHDPEQLPVLLQTATDGADLALGSRYIHGGGVRNWGWKRRLVSRAGNWYARIILGVRVRDLTGGFKCFRRRVLETLDLGAVSSIGYNFQIELTYKALRRGFSVREVPILFTERLVGRSKFHFGIIWESAFAVWRLRVSTRRRALAAPLG